MASIKRSVFLDFIKIVPQTKK